MNKPDYAAIGKEIGVLVAAKNKAYGNSFAQSGDVLRVLYPEGVAPYQYDTLLYITRVLDKLFRMAADNDPDGENPAMDIAGYSILEVARRGKEQ